MAEGDREKDVRDKPATGALRPAQLAAGALASITAAFLASGLGVYGTVVGAGIFSFMWTVGTEVYLRSIDRTKVAAKRATSAARARTARHGLVAQPYPFAPHRSVTTVLAAEAREGPAGHPDGPHPHSGMFGGNLDGADAAAEDEEHGRRFSLRGLRWPLVIGLSVATFALAMLVITGIERVSGSAFSGQDSTTIGTMTGQEAPRQAPPTEEEQPPPPPEEPEPAPPAPETQPPDDPPGEGSPAEPDEPQQHHPPDPPQENDGREPRAPDEEIEDDDEPAIPEENQHGDPDDADE